MTIAADLWDGINQEAGMEARGPLPIISIFAVLVVASVVLFGGLGQARLWDRDEPRNARCAQEMLQRGDWVVPTFDGELRTHKPVLLYWLQMLCYQVLGVTAFAARLPSALCGLATILACYGIARRWLDARAASWSALILATSALFVMASRAATPDAVLIACSTATVFVFTWLVYPRLQRKASCGVAFLAVYVVAGLAVLAKGPVGLILPGAVIWVLVYWETWKPETPRNAYRAILHALTTTWKMHPWTAVLAVALVAGPWYWAVGHATDGVWLEEFFFKHNVSRAVQTMEGHAGPPLLFYLGAFLVGTFPWSILAVPTVLFVRRTWRESPAQRPLIVLASAWVVVYVVAFSAAATKLPSYITPCYPGAALLYGLLVSHWSRSGQHYLGWGRVGLAIAMLVGLGITAFAGFNPTQLSETLGALVPAGFLMAIAAITAAQLMRSHRPELAIRAYTIGAVGLVAALAVMGPAIVDRQRGDLNVLQSMVASPADASPLLVVGAVEPSWIFYGQGRVQTLSRDVWMDDVKRLLQSQPSTEVMLRHEDWERLRSTSATEALVVTLLQQEAAPLSRDTFYRVQLSNEPPAVAQRRGPRATFPPNSATAETGRLIPSFFAKRPQDF